MNFETEFKVVDLILGSEFETRGVDAFSLSILKMERQIRRIFTHIVFQHHSFKDSDIQTLIDKLAGNKKIQFKHFIPAINLLYPKTVEAIYGENYSDSKNRIDAAEEIRNKIFHGQPTGMGLARHELIEVVFNIRCWCTNLATSFNQEIGYDGFARDSYQKSALPEAFKYITWPFNSVDEYSMFLGKVVEKNNKNG
jgi:hypothetical protein